MPITREVIEKVAEDTGVSVDELSISGLLALLREKKRKMMVDRLDMLARYGVTSAEELEKKIKSGEVAEHPAWEDLILFENIEAGITAIDKDIESIQKSS
jgi:ribosomal protein L12E/L44/L45/RPP1/RPP2